jgi:DNA-binding NarL/FixJ family response regulator
MATGKIDLVGGPAPYREALAARLEAAGFVVEGTDDVLALVIYCDSDDRWAHAADAALWTATVAVVPDLEIDRFVRALAMGAGVVHLDTPTDVMVDVVRAAISGEALLPLAITRTLASHDPPGREQILETSLEGIELQVAERLLAGETINQIADGLNYSDRTIRRKLQGIYLKLGVPNRTAAMEELKVRSERQR